jgi:predicted nucleic acid-binding protein
MYLVDTNIVILAMAGQEPDAAFLRQAIRGSLVNLSVIIVAEFLTKASVKEARIFEKLANVFPVLSINETVARIAARYRKRFLQSSKIRLVDAFLAAQAKDQGLILVTNNLADFPMKDIKVATPAELL